MTCTQRSRREWLSILAPSSPGDLDASWHRLARQPAFSWLREPEFGAVMVRARASNTGQEFNLGEMTVTRCSVVLDDGAVGVAYVAGRNKRHAALVALFDAMLQGEAAQALAPLLDDHERRLRARRSGIEAQARESRVAFDMVVQEARP